MSIIQEALKKAHRKSLSAETIKKEPVRQYIREEIPSYIRKAVYSTKSKPAATKSGPRIALYGIALACVALVLFIKYYPSMPAKNIGTQNISLTGDLKDPVEAVAVIHAPVISRIQNIVPAGERKQLIEQENFTLSGIMDLEDGRRAIINNSVVVEGDSIGDIQVETITTNSVTLKNGKDSLMLRLK